MTAPDPLDVLERIHRDVKLLAELAGPAIRVTIEAVTPPAAEEVDEAPPVERTSPPGRSRGEGGPVRQGREFAERVADYLRDHPGARQADIADALGCETKRVIHALGRLGDRVEKGPGRWAPGQSAGRPSPTWTLTDAATPEPQPVRAAPPAAAPPVVTSAIKPRIIECVRNLNRPTFGAIVRELYPGAKLSRNIQPAKAVAALIDAMEEAGELRPDGTYRGGVIYRLADESTRPTEPPIEPDLEPPAFSARTRKSIERAEAETQAAAELGDPPPSRVFDLLRDRNLTIREIAAALGEHQAVVSEEVHGLRPWLEELHDGKLRVAERYRLREAA
jgi:hypothetical protein